MIISVITGKLSVLTNYVNDGNAKYSKYGGLPIKTNSNNEKPYNAGDAEALITLAATTSYNGHILLLPVRCFIILSYGFYFSFSSQNSTIK